jgi:hypothetical protein
MELLSLAVLAAVAAGAYVVSAYLALDLAKQDKFFTSVEEGYAIAIEENKEFKFFLMSYKGHGFNGDVNKVGDSIDYWNIVDDPVRRWRLPLIRGIRWIGFPGFNVVKTYHFTWSSLEEQKDEKSGKLVQRPVPKDIKDLRYISLKRDQYVTRLEEAETTENVPFDSNILIGGKVVNPYRALYRVEKWLEATQNLVKTEMRSYFGQHDYEDLRQMRDDKVEMSEDFVDLIKYIENEFGFRIDSVKLSTLEAAGPAAETFIRSSTLKYNAEKQAEADVIAGEGRAKRDTAHYSAVSAIPGGVDMFKWDAIRNSRLTALAEGGPMTLAVPVGGASPPPAAPATPPAAEPEAVE